MILKDCSSNGTFVNGEKVGKGRTAGLKHGDRISLVLSVAPLVEQYFTYWAGTPPNPEIKNQDGDSKHKSVCGLNVVNAVHVHKSRT